MSFMEKGITLEQLLTGFDFNKNLFRTFAGFFGSYAFGARDWYYTVMAILYLAIIGYLLLGVTGRRTPEPGGRLARRPCLCSSSTR